MNSIQIIHDDPVPEIQSRSERQCLSEAFAAMKPGDSFLWHGNRSTFNVAYRLDLRICTRKLETGGYQVWLLERNYDRSRNDSKIAKR